MTAVVSEPLTYNRHGDHSFFRDLVLRAKEKARAGGESAAEARLNKHWREMRLESIRQKDRRTPGTSGAEFRINPNRTDGQGGFFSPPLWLIEEFSTAARPERVLADLIPSFLLPPGASTVNLPIIETGSATGLDPNLSGTSRDLTDAAGSSEVITITGRVDCSLQQLEQSPPSAAFDFACFTDLMADYDAQLEAQLLAGTGGSLQLQGLSAVVSSANTIVYTDASPTASKIFPYLGQAVAASARARKVPPQVWLMTTPRWAWMATNEDSSGRPLETPGRVAGVGSLVGFQVMLDDAITETQGSIGNTGNQDNIWLCRPSDSLLFESDPGQMVDLESLSGTMGARISLRMYAAAINRRPESVATISGTGLVAQLS